MKEESAKGKKGFLLKEINGKIQSYSLRMIMLPLLKEKNAVVSFQNIKDAFFAAYLGSKGETRKEVAELFDIKEDYKPLQDESSEFTKFVTAVNLAFAEDLVIHPKYVSFIEKYKFGLQKFNFKDESKYSEICDFVNGWVSEKTNGLIPKLINKDLLNPEIGLIIISALYLKLTLSQSFDKKLTHNAKFDGNKEVQMMHREGDYFYYEDEYLQRLQIPFKDSYEIEILLPKNRLADISYADIKKNVNYEDRSVKVYIPKFKAEYDADISNSLKELGLKRSFSSQAEFTEICNEPLRVSKVIHKCTFELSEEGVEASAATGIIMMRMTASIPKASVTFRADKPFVYILKKNDTQLFTGKFEG